MLLNAAEYAALPPHRRRYQMLLDMVGLVAKTTGLRHLVMLSMVDKEGRRRLSFFMKRLLKQKRVFYPKSNRTLLLFDADRHYMTIRYIDEDLFKVCHAGVDYVVTKNLSSAHFVNSSGHTYHPYMSIGEVFLLLIKDLRVKRAMRRTSRRLGGSAKMPVAKIWFENMSTTEHALQGKLNLQVHVDFKQMHLMASARHWFNDARRRNGRFGSDAGVQLCLQLRCIKFD